MKILYGVQGTGNGHISRASAMADALAHYPDVEITWLLSGRDRAMGCGGISRFEWREGLTFITRNGSVKILDTLRKNNMRLFFDDVQNLDLKPYDLVISDFEPVISHAARKRGVPVTGIGHQYAFGYSIPKRGQNPVVNAIMNNYAPVNTGVGLHWHHFNFPILPPIVDMDIPASLPPVQQNKVVVYLPFENPQLVLDLLRPHPEHEFYIYHPGLTRMDEGNLHARPIARLAFKQDLLDARGVITNSGFELISECLELGKCILSKPLKGQMEQLSNAAALQELAYAQVSAKLDQRTLKHWLERPLPAVQIKYPKVAATLAAWIAGSCKESVEELSARLWGQTRGGAGDLALP